MAAVYGVNATKSRTPSAGNIITPGQQHGRVRVMFDTYEAAALAAGSTIQMGHLLPVGATVLNVIIAHDALGGATIDVGDAEDADRYIDGADVSSAGIVSMIEAALVDGIGYSVLGAAATTNGNDDQKVLITTITAAITGTIKAIILYSVD